MYFTVFLNKDDDDDDDDDDDENLKNPTLSRGTYLYSPYMGVPHPPPPRGGGLMVSALVSGSTLAGILGKTLNSHSASLHPGVQMSTGEFNAGANPAMD